MTLAAYTARAEARQKGLIRRPFLLPDMFYVISQGKKAVREEQNLATFA